MAVQFVLGRAGAGKTHWCLSSLRSRLAQAGPQDRLILLVPEQASFQMERALALASPRGAFTQAEVLSFSRLAQRVAESVGGGPTILSRAARVLALRLVGQRRAPELRAYQRAAAQPGFYQHLEKVVEQLLREGITPDALRAAGDRLPDEVRLRVQELARLYADYCAWLGPDRVDPAARFELMAEGLARADWTADASIWVDGFAGFTGIEQAALCSLAARCREMWIALLVDPDDLPRPDAGEPDPLRLFQHPEQTWRSLSQRMRDAGAAILDPLCLRPAPAPRFASVQLDRLERGLVRGAAVDGAGQAQAASDANPAESTEPPVAIRVVRCATQRDELVQAARSIRRKVAGPGKGLRYRDFAVVARDLEPFADLAREVFADFEIPCFIDRRRPLAAHVLTRWAAAVFDCLRSDFAVEPAVRLLQTGLLPLRQGQAERLEQTITEYEVRGFAQWRSGAWRLWERRGDGGKREAPDPPERRRIAAALAPLVELSGRGPAPARQWAEVFYEAARRLELPRVITRWVREARRDQAWESAEVHRLAWDTLAQVLDDLHAVLGDHPLTLEETGDLIVAGMADSSIGLAPPTLDQVLVGSIERSRHPEIRFVWLVGLNEGLMPARPGEDALLSTADRTALVTAGLDALRPAREQSFNERLLAYIAMTRASDGLAISYSRTACDGSELFESPLLRDLRRALPGLLEQDAADDPPLALRELAVQRALAGEQAAPRLTALAARVEQDAQRGPRLHQLLRGMSYVNRERSVGNYRRDAARPDVVWRASPSEVETRLQCPFQHFARYGLRLNTRRGPQPLVADLGLVAHELLSRATGHALASGVDVQALGDEQWDAFLERAQAEIAAAEPPGLDERRPDRAVLMSVLVERIRDVLRVHAERWRRGSWAPWAVELRFSPDAEGERATLALPLPGYGQVWMTGSIDRVDLAQQGGRTYALVYDYKSRAQGTALKTDYLLGDGLAIYLYLLAVQALTPADEPLYPAGVLLAPLRPVEAKLESEAVQQSGADASLHLYQPRGLFDRDLAGLFDPKAAQGQSPVVYAKITKKNEWDRRCDAAGADELAKRLNRSSYALQNLAVEVDAGRVNAEPLLHKRRLACSRCEFSTVCRFELGLNRVRPSGVVLPLLQDRAPQPKRAGPSGEGGEVRP